MTSTMGRVFLAGILGLLMAAAAGAEVISVTVHLTIEADATALAGYTVLSTYDPGEERKLLLRNLSDAATLDTTLSSAVDESGRRYPVASERGGSGQIVRIEASEPPPGSSLTFSLVFRWNALESGDLLKLGDEGAPLIKLHWSPLVWHSRLQELTVHVLTPVLVTEQPDAAHLQERGIWADPCYRSSASPWLGQHRLVYSHTWRDVPGWFVAHVQIYAAEEYWPAAARPEKRVEEHRFTGERSETVAKGSDDEKELVTIERIGGQGLALDGNNRLLVADADQDRIIVFSTDGELLHIWGGSGREPGQLSNPTDISAAPDGTVWVADSGNFRIQQFSAQGKPLLHWSSWQGPQAGTFNQPTGLAVTREGDIWVCDAGNNRLYRFSPDGTLQKSFGEDGSYYGQLNLPWDVELLADGRLVVADRGNYRIQIFTPEGVYETSWNRWRQGYLQEFDSATGLAVAPDGSIYVVDRGNHAVHQFTVEGAFIREFGSLGEAADQFRQPYAIAIGADGTLYVADYGNDRIKKLTREGRFLTMWSNASR